LSGIGILFSIRNALFNTFRVPEIFLDFLSKFWPYFANKEIFTINRSFLPAICFFEVIYWS